MKAAPQIKPESMELLRALLARQDAVTAAEVAFTRAYPDAPPAMIYSAVHHVIVDGLGAAVDWLAAIEAFLRDPEKSLNYGAAWHLLYHLYNWQQFQALLPMGREGLKEQLRDVKLFVEEGDPEPAKAVLDELLKRLDGEITPPNIE